MPNGAAAFHVFSAVRPWMTGQLPADARTAAAWLAAGWEPTPAEFARLGEKRARALGLEYVHVSAWSAWLLPAALAVLAYFLVGQRRRGRRYA